jgi:hypothetical protein|eukprot:COSAG01_NODE_3422_length_6115_cov_4.099402_5_plen_91_part_00
MFLHFPVFIISPAPKQCGNVSKSQSGPGGVGIPELWLPSEACHHDQNRRCNEEQTCRGISVTDPALIVTSIETDEATRGSSGCVTRHGSV